MHSGADDQTRKSYDFATLTRNAGDYSARSAAWGGHTTWADWYSQSLVPQTPQSFGPPLSHNFARLMSALHNQPMDCYFEVVVSPMVPPGEILINHESYNVVPVDWRKALPLAQAFKITMYVNSEHEREVVINGLHREAKPDRGDPRTSASTGDLAIKFASDTAGYIAEVARAIPGTSDSAFPAIAGTGARVVPIHDLPTEKSDEPFIGWRRAMVRFDAERNQGRFASILHSGEPFELLAEAECRCLPSVKHLTPITMAPGLEFGHMCGWYATKTREQLASIGSEFNPLCWNLKVELSGRVIEYTEGFRAQWQRVLSAHYLWSTTPSEHFYSTARCKGPVGFGVKQPMIVGDTLPRMTAIWADEDEERYGTKWTLKEMPGVFGMPVWIGDREYR